MTPEVMLASLSPNSKSDAMETPYQLLPELPTWEYEALKDSIRRLGVLMPVVKDEHGVTIDGHHRERACAELGIANFATMTLVGLTEAEKRDHALLLNLVRRKLNRKQLKQIVEAEIRRSPELSSNWLGGVLGVSKNTVAKIRLELEEAGEIERLTTFKGKDGKRHPATKVITFKAGDAERARQALEILGDDAPKKNIELRLAERRAHKKQRRELIRNWQMQTLGDNGGCVHVRCCLLPVESAICRLRHRRRQRFMRQ